MIEAREVRFRYRKKPLLFDGLSLELAPNSIYGLLGRNGAGKTTLLKLLAGLRFPQDGVINANGYAPWQRDPRFLEDLFFVGEEFAVPPLTPPAYAATYGALYPNFDMDQFQAYATEFDLDPDQKLSEMSYGQKKKALLSFGLASNTGLLILDEPTNGLDIPSKGQFRRILAGAASENRIILISTHQVRDMENLIDPILVLDEGKMIFNHSVDEVTSTIRMGVEAERPAEALYAEKTLGGYAVVQPADDGQDSRVDLELLFNAVTANPQVFAEILGKGVVS